MQGVGGASQLPAHMPLRRALLFGAACASAMGMSSSTRAAEHFSFGLTPLFLDNDLDLLSMLRRYLEQRLNRPVALVKRRTYHEISEMLLTGQLDAAWICDDPYVQHQDKLALLAVPLYHRKPLYQTYVIVNESCTAQSFDEIRGTVHAFSDPDSTSGYLVTRWLLALRETTPAQFFRESFFTYGHRNVMRAVQADLAQSGSIDGYVYDVMAGREPELIRKTRVIFKSEWLGFPPIVAPMASANSSAVREFTAALFALPSDSLGRKILTALALDGFTQGVPSMYESTREKWLLVKAQA